MTFMTYIARVTGYIFDGSKAWTTYEFRTNPSRADVMARASDFARVTAISLTSKTVTVARVPLKK